MDRIATSKFNKHLLKNEVRCRANAPRKDFSNLSQEDLPILLGNELIDPPARVIIRILDISKRTQEI